MASGELGKFAAGLIPATKELGAIMNTTKGTMQTLFASNSKWDCEYGPRFANHLIHGVCSLWALGGDSELLNNFNDVYTTHAHGGGTSHVSLNPAPPSLPLHSYSPSSILLRWRGEIANYSGLTAHFKRARDSLVQIGADATPIQATQRLLVSYIPHLSSGVSGAAFHGLIQTGYALEVGDTATDNVAEGLGYWTQSYRSIGIPTPGVNRASSSKSFNFDPAADLTSVRNFMVEKHGGKLPVEIDRETRFTKRTGRIASDLADLLDSADLGLEDFIRNNFQEKDQEEVSRLVEQVIRKTADGINRTYACSKDDFFVLHLITSFRCLRHVLKAFDSPPTPLSPSQAEQVKLYLDNEEYKQTTSSPYQLSLTKARILDQYWRAIVCSYLCQNFPELNSKWFVPPASSPVPSWEEIRKKSLDFAKNHTINTDEHLYKLVFVYQQDIAEGFFDEGDQEKNQKMDEFLRLVAARKVELLPWTLPA